MTLTHLFQCARALIHVQGLRQANSVLSTANAFLLLPLFCWTLCILQAILALILFPTCGGLERKQFACTCSTRRMKGANPQTFEILDHRVSLRGLLQCVQACTLTDQILWGNHQGLICFQWRLVSMFFSAVQGKFRSELRSMVSIGRCMFEMWTLL